MTNLYSFNGGYPHLPEKIRLSTGMTRTDSSTFTQQELLESGYTGPYEIPDFNSEFQTLIWDSNSRSFSVEDIPEYELWEDIRIERNRRLSDSDWTQSRDVILSNDQDWKDYREELRNIPQTFSDPKSITFPRLPPTIY
jgi:hypothetical protein